jgi:membrane fusion protein (multidrug efflux system)
MLKPLVALIAACTLALVGCAASDAGNTPGADSAAGPGGGAAIPVEVTRPARREMVAGYSGTATLEAEADAEVVARVGGLVERLLVEEGQRVAAGQLLAVLDGRQLRLQADQARAQLAKLERDYRRQVELNQKGLIAAGAFEGLRYDLDNLRAAHQLATLQLSYTELRAPFAGVVANRHIRVGQNLQAGAGAFRVVNSDVLQAQVHVPERQLARLAAGQGASLQVDALSGRGYAASVTRVSPTVDAQTATFKVTLQVADPRHELRPGMFARVGIVFERRARALAVPQAALLDDDAGPAVYIVEHGKAVRRALRVGLSEAGAIEVQSGLDGTEQVVVVGQSGLKEGNAVRIVALEAAPAAAPPAARG